MMDDIMAEAARGPLPLLSSEPSLLSATPPTDADADVDVDADASSSNVASSLSSTPPTSASPDNISLASEQGIAKLITTTTSILEEPQSLLPSLALQDDAKQPESEQQQAGQQPDEQTEQHTELSATQPTQTSAEEPSKDLDARVHREAEAQHVSEPGLVPGELTPAASAIVVAPRSQPASESPSETPQRPRRARASLPVYNISKLAGTDIHGRRRAKGDDVRANRKRRVSAADALTGDAAASSSTERFARELVGDAITALNMEWSIGAPATPPGAKVTKKKSSTLAEVKEETVTRRATRLSGTPVPNAVHGALASFGKRGKKAAEEGLSRISRELKRLQDTKEFAHVDDRPIIQTVWSNGKFVDPRTLDQPAAESRSSTRAKASRETEPDVEAKADVAAVEAAETAAPEAALPQKKRIAKKWLEKGLYAGQETPKDISVGLTAAEKRRLAQFPELAKASEKVNKTLPPPMFNGLRLLLQGRDFKLPYDICSPLPPGHPKPPAYRTMTKNRFVGDAGAYWKKQPHLQDFQSKCVCKPEDGCAEQCQNRIMLYECDDTNCNIGKSHCSNRAFQSLQERTKQGGRFRVGVEVFKTEGKGYGVRSNRCFRPGQIIMEYTGEIITELECERRMNEVYKDNECYYLMSFDQNMIIDATTGSIARFVNHSCSPNCRMIKWIVGGQPRMALFAGDRPIMTGEELTYDYNFDPFSAKNVQKCLCGAENCRGVLGPKPREVKAPKVVVLSKEEMKKAAKRKLQLLDGYEDDDVYDVEKASSGKAFKKRKVTIATGTASSLSKSGLKAAKGAATAIKRSMSNISVSARAALGSKKTSSPLRRVTTGGIVKKTSPGKATAADRAKITTTKAALSALISAGGLPSSKKASKVGQASRSSSASLTIVAAPAKQPQTKAKSALSATTGNAKTKPKSSPSSSLKAKAASRTPSSLKGKTTSRTPPSKRTTPTAKKTQKARHSGYTPPSSPDPEDATTPLKLSARKKVPTRKILESKVAGTASVTKPKPKPGASAKGKAAAVAKKSGFMAAVRKAVRAKSSPALPAVEKDRKGTGRGKGKENERVQHNDSSAAEATIEAVPARLPGSSRRPAASATSSPGSDLTPTPPPLLPLLRLGAEDSPERAPRDAMDVPRVSAQIRLVEG